MHFARGSLRRCTVDMKKGESECHDVRRSEEFSSAGAGFQKKALEVLNPSDGSLPYIFDVKLGVAAE